MSKIIAKVSNLSHKYGDVLALDNINLEIPKGQMIGLIGPDGVGKSTLLSLLSGTKIIQQGKVDILNFDLSNKKAKEAIFEKIAYMPQGLGKNLYMTLSVYENIEFFAKLFGLNRDDRKERILQLLKSTDLIKFKDRPAGSGVQTGQLSCTLNIPEAATATVALFNVRTTFYVLFATRNK